MNIPESSVIHIISGEGEQGTRSIYCGPRDLASIEAELEHERAGGQRWARAEINGRRLEELKDLLGLTWTTYKPLRNEWMD